MSDSTTYSITDTDFAKLQKMARLTLTDEEKKSIHSQLDEALNAIKVFDELDLTNVPPLSHPGNLQNIMREDVVTTSFTQEQALANAPASHNGFVMAPHVLGEST